MTEITADILKAKIAERKAAAEQALANANLIHGQMLAYEDMLTTLAAPEAPKEPASHAGD